MKRPVNPPPIIMGTPTKGPPKNPSNPKAAPANMAAPFTEDGSSSLR